MEPSILKLGLALGILGIPFCAWASPRFAHFLRAKQHIRPEGPTTHGKKEGTPTMGGIIPIAWILVWGAIFLALLGESGENRARFSFHGAFRTGWAFG
jgi:UDP-N-acetylmuramyl pentapeptide phosphotransferase/UDP-N-acetylglucosamine-1-phosphate transferase